MYKNHKNIILVLITLLLCLSGLSAREARYFSPYEYEDFLDCIIEAYWCYDRIVDYINEGIDVNYHYDRDYTPLHYAAAYDRPATTELLIRNGALINVKNENGDTPLMLAIYNRSFDAMEQLLKYDAQIKSANNKGLSTLMRALITDQKAYQTLLSKAKTPDFDEMAYAVLMESRSYIRALIEDGYSVDQPNSYGWSALQISVRNPRNEILNFIPSTMIDYSKNLSVLTDNGDNLMNLAALGGDHWTVRHLIKNGVDINHQNKQGLSPIMQIFVDKHSDESCVQAMLASGANPNLQDNRGWTALMYAANSWASKNIVLSLLEAGANAHLRNHDGKTAIDIANARRYPDFAKTVNSFKPKK